MENRNATFLESLLYVPLSMDTEIDFKETDCAEQDTCIKRHYRPHTLPWPIRLTK